MLLPGPDLVIHIEPVDFDDRFSMAVFTTATVLISLPGALLFCDIFSKSDKNLKLRNG